MYINSGKYRFKLVDKYGYDIDNFTFRKIKISSILEENVEEIDYQYHLILLNDNGNLFMHENIFWNPYTKIMSFKEIEFYKETILDVSLFVDTINNYKASPINIINYKFYF